MRAVTAVFVLMCASNAVSCANILAFVPTVSKSHYVGFEALIRELALRGHNLTVVTVFPQDRPVDNVHEISVRALKDERFNSLGFGQLMSIPERFSDAMHFLSYYIKTSMDIFNSTDVSELLSSDSKFDLIISEVFMEDMYLGIRHKFKAPVIGMSTCTMFPWVPTRFGIPDNPGLYPVFSSDFTPRMDLYQRIYNTVLYTVYRVYFWGFVEPEMTEVARRQFGSDMPRVGQLVQNFSLYFVSTHFSFFGAQPYPPQVIDVSGLHLKPAKPLSQELDRWMNESTAGVIYFSFGSMLRGSTLPTDKVNAFLQVFGSLPQRVLWKWEDDTTHTLPDNVKVMKWLPQRDVLAHPAVRVFISHGGLLGTTEAVVSGVPILGIPMYGDQPNNVAALVGNGVAIHVDYHNISVASLSYALNALINDKSYAENTRQLSRRFLDRPQSPLDTAVYWTEYVLRHRGAPHLRSAAVHLTWYQYYLLDVIAVLLAAVVLLLALAYYTLRSCLRLVLSKKSAKLKTN